MEDHRTPLHETISRSNSYDNIRVLVIVVLTMGVKNVYHMDWPLVNQDSNNQGNDGSTGNSRDENNTGNEAHGRTLGIGIDYTRRNSNTIAWMGSCSLRLRSVCPDVS